MTLTPSAYRILRKTLLAYLNRIACIQTNAGNAISEDMLERLLGAEQALREATQPQKQNYLDKWLTDSEALIIERHRTKPAPCGCGVCRGAK